MDSNSTVPHAGDAVEARRLSRALTIRCAIALALVVALEAGTWFADRAAHRRIEADQAIAADGRTLAFLSERTAKEAMALRAALRAGRQGEAMARGAALAAATSEWAEKSARFRRLAGSEAASIIEGAEPIRNEIAAAALELSANPAGLTLESASPRVETILQQEEDYASRVDAASRSFARRSEADYERTESFSQWHRVANLLAIALIGLFVLRPAAGVARRALARAAEERDSQRRLFLGSPAPMLVIDPATLEIVDANPAAERFYGHDSDSMKRSTLSDLGNKEREAALEEIARAAQSGSSQFEARHRLSSGEERDVLVQCAAIQIGGKTFAHAIVADITERKNAEEEARRAGIRYREMFEKTSAAKLLLDPELDAIVDANQAACDFYGHTRDSLKAKRMSDLESQARAEAMREIARAGVASESRYESRHRIAAGETRDVEVFCGPAEIDGRALINAIVVDITERKRAERRLRRATSQLQAMFASLPDLFFTLDAEGVIRDHQSGTLEDLHMEPSRFMGRNMEEILPPDAAELHREAFDLSRQTRSLVSIEYALRVPRGVQEFEARYLPMGEGSTLVVARNITDQKRAAAALALNEKRYRAMFELSPEGVALSTAQGRFLAANPAFEAMAGRPLSEAAEVDFHVLLADAEDIDRCAERLRVAAGGETVESVAKIRRKDGETRYLELRQTAIPLFGGDAGVLTIASDVTERLRREEELRRHAMIVETMTDGVALFNARGRIVSANPAMAMLAGRAVEEMLGMSAEDAWGEEGASLRATSRGAANVRLVTSGGQERYASARSFELSSAEEPLQVSIYRDMTAQQKAERALRESERRLRDFLDNANDLIQMVDERGRLLYVNRCWEAKLGRELQSPGSLNAFDVISPACVEGCAETLRRLAEGEIENSTVEAAFLAADGREIPVEGNVAVLREEGKPAIILGIYRDVTERKRAEEALRQSERRLWTLYSISKDLELDVDDQIETALEKAAEFLGQSFGYINRADGKECVLAHCSAGAPSGLGFERGCRSDGDQTYCGIAMASGDVAAIEKMGETQWRGRGRYKETKLESHLGVALRVGGRLYGALGFSRLEARGTPWTEDDKQFARLLSELMARALERREAREALRRSEERYRAVVEDQTEMVCRFQPDARISFANVAFARAFARDRERVEGRRFLPIMAPEHRRRWRELVGALSAENPTTRLEVPVRAPDGEQRWQEWTVRLIAPFDPEAPEYQAVGRDVTDRRRAEEALGASELKLRFIIENTADAIFIKDMEGRYTLMNPAGAAAFGMTPAEVAGKTDFDLFGKEAGARIRSEDREIMERRVTTSNEREALYDGRPRVYLTQKFPFLSEEGSVMGLIGVAHDITELRRAEAETRRAKVTLERIVNGSLDMIVSADAEGNITEFNPAAEKAYGASREDVVGKPAAALMAGGALGLENPSTGGQFVGEVICLRSDGAKFPAFVSATLLRDAEGKVVGSMGIARDITERKKAEEELRSTRDRLEMALWGSNLGLWDWNIPTGEVLVNERWATMLGYEPTEVPRRVEFWESILHPADKERVEETLGGHLRGETDFFQAEYRLRMNNGGWKWVNDCGKVVGRDAAGSPVRAVGTHQDIDERKRAEAALKAAERERGEFYRFLVHDLNKPLAAIVGFADRLCAPAAGLEGRSAKYAETTRNAAIRMRDIVGQFMQTEQLRRGDITLHPTEFNVWEQIADIARLLMERHEGREIRVGGLSLDRASDLPPRGLLSDRVCFCRVAQNLLDNALKYGQTVAEVEVEKAEGGGVVLSFWNDGPGIAPEERERIFGEYYRSGNKVGIEGYGLGLSAATRLAKLLGGRLWIDDPPAKKGGALFRFEAPRIEAGPKE